MAGNNRAEQTRAAWLSTLEKHRHDFDGPGSDEYWSPKLDTASRDEIIAIQNDKLAVVTPFLYENSPFYRARFDRLGNLRAITSPAHISEQTVRRQEDVKI